MDFLDQEATLHDEHIVSTEKETPAESPTAKTDTQTQSSDGANSQDELPAHLQPAWLAREDRFKRQLEETKADYIQRMSDLEQRLTPREEAKIAASPFLTKLVGDDAELAKDWEAEKESIRQETIRAYESHQQEIVVARQAEEQRWTGWVENSIGKLKSEGKEFDENELKSIAIKYKPTDDAGNIDFSLAYELLMEKKAVEKEKEAEKSTARKQVAAGTSSTSKGESKARDYMTHSDFR